MADGHQAAHRASRAACPSSTCPAYHYWLNRSAADGGATSASWIEPFEPIHAGLALVLRLLRENARTSRHTRTAACSS
jgi:cell division FtsZ-interacting protein ZapD